MSASPKPLVVEFLGLPGAGKSTLSHLVAERLRRAGRGVSEPIRGLSDRTGAGARLRGYAGKSGHAGRELLLHPLGALRAARVIAATGQQTPAALLKVTFNWWVQCSVARTRRAAPGIHLFEEGIFQALWSIALEARRSARQAATLLDSGCPLPDAVVVVEADTEAVAGRLADRGGRESRADRWDPGDREVFARAAALLSDVGEALADTSERLGRPWILRVRNAPQADLAATAAAIARELERLADAAAPARARRAPGRAPGYLGGGASPASRSQTT